MKHCLLQMLLLIAILAIVNPPTHATSLQRLGLDDMTQRADKIFRGVVVDVEQTSMYLGGADIPIVRYRLQVQEQLKGSADVEKGSNAYVEIKMLGSIKDVSSSANGLTHFNFFRDIPRLQMGSDYVLFTTPRSHVGLSTMVGLGQGAFDISTSDKQDMVMNQYGNANIDAADGRPMTYETLKMAVTAAMAQ